jgi:hypothetical protein
LQCLALRQTLASRHSTPVALSAGVLPVQGWRAITGEEPEQPESPESPPQEHQKPKNSSQPAGVASVENGNSSWADCCGSSCDGLNTGCDLANCGHQSCDPGSERHCALTDCTSLDCNFIDCSHLDCSGLDCGGLDCGGCG